MLACGDEAKGRLAKPEKIVEYVKTLVKEWVVWEK
jgi:phosphopantothenoylcysteine synthetase/decarboxylase